MDQLNAPSGDLQGNNMPVSDVAIPEEVNQMIATTNPDSPNIAKAGSDVSNLIKASSEEVYNLNGDLYKHSKSPSQERDYSSQEQPNFQKNQSDSRGVFLE